MIHEKNIPIVIWLAGIYQRTSISLSENTDQNFFSNMRAKGESAGKRMWATENVEMRTHRNHQDTHGYFTRERRSEHGIISVCILGEIEVQRGQHRCNGTLDGRCIGLITTSPCVCERIICVWNEVAYLGIFASRIQRYTR